MAAGFTPLFSCVLAILVTIACSWLRRETRMGLKEIAAACEEAVRGAVGVGVCCAIIGVIVGTVSLTGVGLKFGALMLRAVDLLPPAFAGLRMLAAAVMVALLATVLGMGVPGIAAFVIVTAVALPVMTRVGCAPLPASLFCLYYASLSNITPPVAICAYVAAGIAGANQTRAGWLAVRVGLSGFLLPFFFLLNPVLLLFQGMEETGGGAAALTAVRSVLSAALGIAALAAGTEGWLFTKSRPLERFFCLAAALLLLDPALWTDAAGFCLVAIVGALQQGRRRAFFN